VPSDDAEQNVRIDEGVPIYISYLTARPDGEKIAIADDVYKLDAAPAGGTTVAAATASADK
jgi:murein L,D-transpeptidase YcbB/YkuD